MIGLVIGLAVYPLVVLLVAITGPHSETERKELLAVKQAKAIARGKKP